MEEFKKIKNQGYSISDEEFSLNIIGIGAPIFSPDGKIWAAISIGAPKIRVDNIKLDKYIFNSSNCWKNVKRIKKIFKILKNESLKKIFLNFVFRLEFFKNLGCLSNGVDCNKIN